MIWIMLVLAVLSYFTTKKSSGSSSKAVMAAGLAAAGSYYVGTQTEWGKGVADAVSGGVSSPTDAPTTTSSDGLSKTATAVVNGTTEVLKSWGGTGTAAVVGTSALASQAGSNKWVVPALFAAGLYLLLK